MSSTISLKGIKIFNAIAFQIGWFICVLENSFSGFVFVSILTIVQLFLLHLISDKFQLKKEIFWLLVISAIGLCVETIFFTMGMLYENIRTANSIDFIAPPLWMIYLWLLFATALRTSLTFVFNKSWFIYLLGAIVPPFSYFAGAHLNTAVSINQPIALSLAIISLVWIFALWIIRNIKYYYFEDIFNDH